MSKSLGKIGSPSAMAYEPPLEDPAHIPCECSILGDGCAVCNPKLAAELEDKDEDEL